LECLAQCIINERQPDHIDRLLLLASTCEPWQQAAVLNAIADRVQRGRHPYKAVGFPAAPTGWIALQTNTSFSLDRIAPLLGWPGKPGYIPPLPAPRLTTEEQERFDLGQKLFSASCAACHRVNGLGQPGVAPPLADSEWVMGSEERLIRIVLQGAEGPITAAGAAFDSSMPSWASFNDGQIAGILTYIRRNWENAAAPVRSASVAAIRSRVSQRQRPWTALELSAIP
jgi:mono/diheme cytochrome c family protein